MPYINVDRPKFFINELSYQDSINNLKMGYISSGEMIEMALPIYNHPEKGFTLEALLNNLSSQPLGLVLPSAHALPIT